MSKSTVLTLSFMNLVVGIFFYVLLILAQLFGPELFSGSLVMLLIVIVIFLLVVVASLSLWMALIVAVAKDASQRGKSGVFCLLPLFIGWLGGIIYYAIISSDGNSSSKTNPQKSAK